MPIKLNQQDMMRWVLFFVFVTLFTVIVVATLLAVFFGVGQLTPNERDLLFKIFIVEIGLAVAALFYALFGLKGKKKEQRVRLLPADGDIKQLLNKIVVFTPRLSNGEALPDIEATIVDDKDPHCLLSFPEGTQSLYVSVNLGAVPYEGSFSSDAYYVDLARKQ